MVSWKKVPEGYLGLHGKVLLHKKGKIWVLTIDGRDHEIRAKRPSFDHAEGILKELGKMATTRNANNAKLYYQLVDTLKQLEDKGEDPAAVVQHALRQVKKKVYSYDRSQQTTVEELEAMAFNSAGPEGAIEHP